MSTVEKTRTDECGLVLILSLVILVLIGGLIATYLSVSAANLQLTTNSQETLQALYVAETGLARAFHELNLDNTAAFVNTQRAADQGANGELVGTYTADKNGTTVEVGTYGVLYFAPTPGVNPFTKLVSTGQFNGSRRALEATFGPPPFDLHHAILSDVDIEIEGSVTIQGDVHSNANIQIEGTNGNDHGDPGAGALTVLPAPGALSDPNNPNWFQGNLSTSGDIQLEGAGATTDVSGTVSTGADSVSLPTMDMPTVIAAADSMGMPVIQVAEADAPAFLSAAPLNGIYIIISDHGGGGLGELEAKHDAANMSLAVADGGTAVIIAREVEFEHGTSQIANVNADGTVSLMLWATSNGDHGGKFETEDASTVNAVVYVDGGEAELKGDHGGSPTLNGSLLVAGTAEELEFGGEHGGGVNVNYYPPNSTLMGFLGYMAGNWSLRSLREVGADGP